MNQCFKQRQHSSPKSRESRHLSLSASDSAFQSSRRTSLMVHQICWPSCCHRVMRQPPISIWSSLTNSGIRALRKHFNLLHLVVWFGWRTCIGCRFSHAIDHVIMSISWFWGRNGELLRSGFKIDKIAELGCSLQLSEPETANLSNSVQLPYFVKRTWAVSEIRVP